MRHALGDYVREIEFEEVDGLDEGTGGGAADFD